MTNSEKKIIQNYKQEIRQLLPIFTQREKRFLKDICDTIADYAEEENSLTFESLILNIGEPKDIVSRYLMDMDSEILRKHLSYARYFRIISIVIICTVFLCGAFKIGTDYLSFLEAREAYIHREVTEIINHGEVEPLPEDTQDK